MKNYLKAIAFTLCAAFSTDAMAQSAPAWKSYQNTGNPADIIKSTDVATWLGYKVDVTNGSATGLKLTGAQVPTLPTDTPGASGTAVPNTSWVDKYYSPKSWFITSNTTWTVCASGCNYTSPLDAWYAALGANFVNGAILTISISDGTYNLADQFFTNTPNTSHVHVIGNTSDASKVVLNFTNAKGTNGNGFAAYNGGIIGLIDGVTIQAPKDGTGPLASTDSSGRYLWNSNSYGSGVQAFGSGSNIQLGSHVAIYWFYYSVTADNGGGVFATSGGVTGANAGDVNFMARGGGVIVCTPCTAFGASDYTSPSTAVLGSNFDAERGGTLYIDGSTGKWGLVNGIVGISGGAIWAHNVTLTGGLNIGGHAIAMWSGSHGEFSGCTVSGGYNTGADIEDTSFADLSNCNISGNAIGIYINGGLAKGSSVTIANNTQYGIRVLNQGRGIFDSTFSLMSGNATNFAVQAAGTVSTSGTAYTASSLSVQ